ncbi:NAD(P)-dependent oxidoreductase [Streptomyces sp. Cmuel-A718b]|uniref:imine reductase family protein n=1 Tax=Streptomyces sp. Cmuel-A718b TaxID=697328 RepID=UPI00081E05B4|nr:NAD(P)-dependent oxidoreductase [Streptomyces sp. Cmuel-A718b]SCF65019.1 hypothetical protein GA0115280_104947 [Streptomyces sp. Cmuel-A718b]
MNLANSSPERAREPAGLFAGYGADYLDGAMMALPETVATDEAFFLCSGSERVFTAYREELEVVASAHCFGTDPGAAEVHDLAVLGTGYAALTGFLHALALLEPSGTDPEAFASLVARGSSPAGCAGWPRSCRNWPGRRGPARTGTGSPPST